MAPVTPLIFILVAVFTYSCLSTQFLNITLIEAPVSINKFNLVPLYWT